MEIKVSRWALGFVIPSKPKTKVGHPTRQYTFARTISTLPTVSATVQIPNLVSVESRFPLMRETEIIGSSEARKRYLWVEFDQPLRIPWRYLYCRMLRQRTWSVLISSNEGEQFVPPEEGSNKPWSRKTPRQIIPGQSDDKAGIGCLCNHDSGDR